MLLGSHRSFLVRTVTVSTLASNDILGKYGLVSAIVMQFVSCGKRQISFFLSSGVMHNLRVRSAVPCKKPQSVTQLQMSLAKLFKSVSP
jgi:hypothetical protein